MTRTRLAIAAVAAIITALTVAVRADDATKLDLAICILAENNHSKPEGSAAVAWVLKKRAAQKGVTLREMTRDYCAIFSKTSARYYGTRPDIIRQGTLENAPKGYRKTWPTLLSFVDRFLRGEVEDPCPICRHWAGRTDRVPANWVCVLGPPRTANTFCYVRAKGE